MRDREGKPQALRHETLSGGFGRVKLIQTSEEDPNVLQNVTPKPKLNSCLCCQAPHRRLETSHFCCAGATPPTAQSTWEEAEDTRSHPAARFVSLAVHCFAWVRSSAALALPLIHVDIRSPILSVCFPSCSRPRELSPAAKHSDVQLCLPKSAHVEKTHVRNNQPVLHYLH